MIESLSIWSAKNLCLNGFYTKSKQSRLQYFVVGVLGKRTFLGVDFLGKRTFLCVIFIGKRTSL